MTLNFDNTPTQLPLNYLKFSDEHHSNLVGETQTQSLFIRSKSITKTSKSPLTSYLSHGVH